MLFYNRILLFIISFIASVACLAQSRVQQFTATQYKQSILLNFVITPGNSCTGYQIQQSGDSLNFNILYDFSGICGELTKPQSFSFTDETPLKNSVNYYRILIMPTDYSTITSVVFSDISEKGYLLYSNPITQNLKLLCNSANGKLKIYNQTGNMVKEFIADEKSLFNEDLSSWPQGLYYFTIETNIGNNVRGKFLKE